MIPPDRLHAMAYADNLTRIYMVKRFRRKYPGLFEHAVLETRPASSSRKDYYAPPSLGDRCVVVEKLAWNREGCRLAACFPYKSYEEACVPGVDEMQRVRLDNVRSIEACQPACERGMPYDSRYDDGREDCFVSNAAKKLFVMYPEKYNGAVAKHVRLALDPDSERLRIDEAYCQAYGLSFDAEARDCFLRTTQYVAEILIGSSVFRRHLISKNYVRKPPNIQPPPGPSDLADSFERAWEKAEITDETVDLDKTRDPSDVLERDPDGSRDGALKLDELARWLAVELSVDFGVQVGMHYLKNYLARKISAKLAAQVLKDGALKSAVLHGTLAAATRAGAATGAKAASFGIRGSFSAASLAMGIFGITSLLIDVFDPYEYGKVMNREAVDRIDRVLDLRYFGTDRFRDVRLTPEDAWEVLSDEKDEEAKARYYKRRYDEYLRALLPEAERGRELPRLSLVPDPQTPFPKRIPKWFSHWTVAAAGLALAGFCFLPHVDYLAVFLGALFLFWFSQTWSER